jgi:hypothetical protein
MVADRLHEAMVYRAHGLHPIPFYPHSKTPTFAEGEIQRYRERVPSTDELRRWFRSPDMNIGLITGVDGFHILDVDGDVGRESLKRLPALPRTPTLITGRGAQYYFHGNEALPSQIGLLPGIDFLSSGYQALTASSVHPDGPVYRFADGLSLVDVERASLPAWIFGLLAPIKPSESEAPARPERRQSARPLESRYLSSGAPVLLDTAPHVSACNPSDVRGLFGDFAANQYAAAWLGLPRLGSKFLCFYHPERRPSMSLYADKRTGAWKVHDWHERGVHAHYGLADIFASRITGREVRLDGSPTLTVWWLRLLITSGYVAPADVPGEGTARRADALRRLYSEFPGSVAVRPR